MTQRLGIPDQTGGRSGKPDGTLQLLFFFCEVSLASYLPFFGTRTLGVASRPADVQVAFDSAEGRRAKAKRTFRVPTGPGARSAREA